MIARRVLRTVAGGDTSDLGDVSTLADLEGWMIWPRITWAGRGHRIIAKGLTLFGLSAACLMGMGGAARAGGTCQMQELGEIPLHDEAGRLTLDAEINGRPVRMLLDTGSSETVLTRAGAGDLGLRTVPLNYNIEFYGVGGRDGATSVVVNEFKLGGLIAHKIHMFVTGLHAFGDAVGLVGARFLLESDVEFDVPESKLRLFKPQSCSGDQVVYWGGAYSVAPMTSSYTQQDIEVTVRVNGTLVTALMDTGADTSVLTLDAAARAGVTPKSPGVTGDSPSVGMGWEEEPTFVGVFPSFAFGDETIKNAKLQFADLFRADKENNTLNTHIAHQVVPYQMLLGADFFRSHRVYVSQSQRKVYVSYIGGPVFQTAQTPKAPPAATATK